MIEPIEHAPILHARAEPDIWQRLDARQHLRNPVRPFGENLIRVPRRFPHYAPYALDEGLRHTVVKQVGHRVDENALRLSPCARNGQRFLVTDDLTRPDRATAALPG